MQIFIPTLGRPDKQETWRNLPDSVREMTTLLVDAEDFEKYRAFPHIVLDDDVHGIGKVREWVIQHATDKVVMLDDDLRFAMRRNDDPTKFRDADAIDVERIFETLNSCLSSYAHASIATREGGNRETNPYTFNGRLLRVLAYRADILRKEGVHFTRLPVMEDFDVTLQLLRMGYPNISINWAVQDQLGSNLAGGCSTYRTLGVQRSAAYGLASEHPEFVTVVTKQTKTAWQGQERTDVRIQWKQAFNSAGTPKVLDGGA